jgi:hypothetical protein
MKIRTKWVAVLSVVMFAAAGMSLARQASGPLYPVHLESVEYPQSALAIQLQGIVDMDITIDSNGKVISALANMGHPIFRQAAEENMRRWTFSPGGERTAKVFYEFRLEKPEMYCPRMRTVFDLPGRVRVYSNYQQPQ